jgi:hypothetical protein
VKTQDPIIRAEAEKKIKEQKQLYEEEFQQSIADIDRNFKLKKEEMIRMNEEEIEQERSVWEKYKVDQQAKIKQEIDQELDNKIKGFKD